MNSHTLYRTENNHKMLCGVCGGRAEHFEIDPTLVRLGWVVASLGTFSIGFWAYLLCALLLPRKSDLFPAE